MSLAHVTNRSYDCSRSIFNFPSYTKIYPYRLHHLKVIFCSKVLACIFAYSINKPPRRPEFNRIACVFMSVSYLIMQFCALILRIQDDRFHTDFLLIGIKKIISYSNSSKNSDESNLSDLSNNDQLNIIQLFGKHVILDHTRCFFTRYFSRDRYHVAISLTKNLR